MDVAKKLGILADAAKYDVSCSTSGSARKNTPGGIGNGAVGGICHAWAADGRCVALLKVLLSNACAYDCAYCVNRRSNDVARASFGPQELVRLIIDFYRRNYIEGAFLSSGVIGCPDTTMERLIAVAKLLRVRERFNGYLHLKAIPGASDELVLEAARWADRVSVNIELPSAASLARIAPDKSPAAIFRPMRVLARASGFEPRRLTGAAAPPPLGEPSWPAGRNSLPIVAEPQPVYRAEGSSVSVHEARRGRYRDPGAATLPAGQTTQMVIGASPESDADILTLAENLYLAYDVRRVYYSAFTPAGCDPRVPALARPPLRREHRLYQADWLFRFYGFTASEILSGGSPFLDDLIDPKASWALRNINFFPVDVNSASYADILRVPGIGPTSAQRILRSRRLHRLRLEHLAPLGVVMKRARWFVCGEGREPTGASRLRVMEHPLRLRAFLIEAESGRTEAGQLEFDYGSGV